MGKYLTALIGLGLMALGAWGARASWPALRMVLSAALPLIALAVGLCAFSIGAAEIWDSLRSRPRDSSPSAP
jgi:hypothetical protein